MINRPPAGRCVHCLRTNVPRTWDHVFPKSWYPETTAPNVEKWRIPACERCNKRLGQLEEEMLLHLGLCIDPGLAATAGIVPKVLRALDPSFAKNPKDARLRERKLKKIMGGVIEEKQIDGQSEYPTTIVRSPTAVRRFVSIPATNFRRLTEKIVRGIVYIDRQACIEPAYVIEHYAIADEASKPIVDVLDRFGTILRMNLELWFEEQYRKKIRSLQFSRSRSGSHSRCLRLSMILRAMMQPQMLEA